MKTFDGLTFWFNIDWFVFMSVYRDRLLWFASIMDRILILALLIGLASAQINFSTSWGKRSSPTSATGPALPIQYQQQHHSSSRKESLGTLQPILSEYPEMSEDQRATILPTPCLSLLKSLLLVNQIVEVSFWPTDGTTSSRVTKAPSDQNLFIGCASCVRPFYESVRSQLGGQLIIDETEGWCVQFV